VKVTSERQPGCLVELTIEASAEEMDEAKAEAYREMAPQVAVPGFRPGKAPRHMIVRQIGDERLLTEALGRLISRLYEDALTQESLVAYADGEVRVLQRDPAIIKAVVPLGPTVTLGDYNSVRMQRETVVVDDFEVDDSLAKLQDEHATWAPVGDDRTVQLGDQVVADLRGAVGENVFVDRKGLEMLISEERGIIIPGLATEIVGTPRETERRIQMVIPETFSKVDVRDQEAEFVVTVHEIKEKQLPSLDDEFAKSFGEAADMAELRGRVREALQRGKENDAEERFRADLVARVVAMSTVEYPRAMVEDELDLLVRRAGDRWKERGLDLDTYLKIVEKTRESFRSELEPEAKRRLESGLVLGQLADAEKLAVEPSEVTSEIERASAVYGVKADEARKAFSSERARRSMAIMLLEQKSMERLITLALREADAPAEAAPVAVVDSAVEAAVEAAAETATEAAE
jgi:trigger factor